MGTPTAITDDPPSGSIGSILNMPDRLERLMFGQNVDLTPAEFLLHAGTSYEQRVMHHLNQYGAMLRTIGVLAGVVGTDEERDELVDAITTAMKQYGQTLAEQNQRAHFYSDFNSPVDLISTSAGAVETLWGGLQSGVGAGVSWVGRQTGSENIEWAGGVASAYGQEDIREGIDTIYTNYDGMAIQAATDLWNSVVKGAIEWWNWFTTQVKEEGLIIALGQAHVDAGFLVAEIALDVAISLVTAGWGGAAFRAIRVVGRRVVDGATDVIVKLARQGAPDIDVKRLVVRDEDIPASIKEQVPELETRQGHPEVETQVTPVAPTPQTTRVAGDAGEGAPVPQTSGTTVSDADWDALRSRTPSNQVRREVQSQHPVASKTSPVDDEFLPGLQRTSTIEADHIVPAARIRNMNGFADLTDAHKLEVLNYSGNFHGMSRSANASRGDLPFTEWTEHKRTGTPVDPAMRLRMIAEEARLENELQQMIYERLRRQADGNGVPFRSD